MAFVSNDFQRYLVGTWTFTDPDCPLDTPLHTLVAGAPAAIAPGAMAVYYGAVDPGDGSVILLHNDLNRSAMSRQRLTREGTLVEEGRWSSGGAGGSFVAFDRTGDYFAVANARAGWAVFRDDPVPRRVASFDHEGRGPHPRQAKSHPHCIVFSEDNRWLYAVDMGADVVLALPFDARSGAVGEKRIAYHARPGSGPRHVLCREGLVYLLNELGNTLVVLRPGLDGGLREAQVIQTLPDGFAGDSHTAHLAADREGPFLYASNRGHDSIATFELGRDGLVFRRDWTPSGGKWPWFFAITPGRRMVVANNLSDSIEIFEIGQRGELTPVEKIDVPRPVFIAQI